MVPPPSRLSGRFLRCAFSLVEVALALGIFAFAIVGVVGLVSVALHSARESQTETHAAQIARQIVADLDAAPPGTGWVVLGTNFADAGVLLERDLSQVWDGTVFYDAGGRALGTNMGSQAHFAVRIQVQPERPAPGLVRVGVHIESPAQASSGKCSRHAFVTFLQP